MYGAGLLRQAVAGQNDWRFLYLSSLSLAEGAEAEKGVFRGPAGEIPHTTGRVPPAGAGGRRTMRNSAVVIEKGRKAGGQNMLILHGGHPARRCRRIEREGICYADALLLAPPTRL